MTRPAAMEVVPMPRLLHVTKRTFVRAVGRRRGCVSSVPFHVADCQTSFGVAMTTPPDADGDVIILGILLEIDNVIPGVHFAVFVELHGVVGGIQERDVFQVIEQSASFESRHGRTNASSVRA